DLVSQYERTTYESSLPEIRGEIAQIDIRLESLLGPPEGWKSRLDFMSRQEEINLGFSQMGKGIGCALLAGIVSLIGYVATGPGGQYYVFWGGAAFGAWLFKGLYKFIRNKYR
ncbi:MAG: hypothetical protein ACR2OU_20765, partial [Thermomicrobiales bacterium]